MAHAAAAIPFCIVFYWIAVFLEMLPIRIMQQQLCKHKELLYRLKYENYGTPGLQSQM